MPPGAPQPSSSLSGESPLALAPTVGDLNSADLFGSGTTNGSGNGTANGHGHGHGHGHGSGSASGDANGNGTVTTTSAHDQGSQSAPAGPAVPAACLACVSSPPLLSPLLHFVPLQSLSPCSSPPGIHPVPGGRSCSLPLCRFVFIGLTHAHAGICNDSVANTSSAMARLPAPAVWHHSLSVSMSPPDGGTRARAEAPPTTQTSGTHPRPLMPPMSPLRPDPTAAPCCSGPPPPP